MRFFSNDAREADDELAHDERPDRVQSDPVAVPNQRPPSPWSNTPSTGDAAADDEPRDPAADAVDEDDTTRAEERTTAVGVASPPENRWGTVTTADTPYAGSPAATETAETRLDDEDRVDAHDHGGPADDVDVPLDEPAKGDASEEDEDAEEARARSGEGDSDKAESDDDEDEEKAEKDVDGTEAVSEPTDEAEADASADDETRAADADEPTDEDRVDAPEAVVPVTDAPLAADDTPATDEPAAADTAVAAVPVPVGAAATAAVAKAETIFGADDARSFQERWREVQLHFVDSPKDAAAEATTLIDEAVDKLTAGLKAQRDDLIDDTEDTERLRLQLRGYRDILNRILSL
ncbi:hypothetical protein ACIBSW_31515 [Actinoplanes sp. NPDC049668]|uniref:hypothetical protein n=1 Tax=unclassified Actinoplanes TaxID=2626549 RepID=UPI0033AC6E72